MLRCSQSLVGRYGFNLNCVKYQNGRKVCVIHLHSAQAKLQVDMNPVDASSDSKASAKGKQRQQRKKAAAAAAMNDDDEEDDDEDEGDEGDESMMPPQHSYKPVSPSDVHRLYNSGCTIQVHHPQVCNCCRALSSAQRLCALAALQRADVARQRSTRALFRVPGRRECVHHASKCGCCGSAAF